MLDVVARLLTRCAEPDTGLYWDWTSDEWDALLGRTVASRTTEHQQAGSSRSRTQEPGRTALWTPAEVAALLADLRGHRRGRAKPIAQNLPFGLMLQHEQQRLMVGFGQVHRASSLGQPHLNSERCEQCDHDLCLTTGESPLELADHHRASKPRSGSSAAVSPVAAWGRRAQGRLRDVPMSKNSATICPCPAITRPAASTCHARDDTGS